MRKFLAMLLLATLPACQQETGDSAERLALESETLGVMAANLQVALAKAYAGVPLDIDSLFSAYYHPDAYYVTPWGSSEPIDSTKQRLKSALPRVREYEYSVENLHSASYGRGGYAWFILRQRYLVDGLALDEYLPTTLIFERQGDRFVIVHAHRSTDLHTLRQYLERSGMPAPRGK